MSHPAFVTPCICHTLHLSHFQIGPDDSITCLPPHKSPVKKLDLSALKKERVDEAVDDQEEEEEEEEDSHYGERNVSLAKGIKFS